MYVTNKTKTIQFDIRQVDFIVTLVDNVPKALTQEAILNNKPIVTATWFTQCLINNQLFDVDDSTDFFYRVDHDDGGDDGQLDTT